jgi:hypothetical protein
MVFEWWLCQGDKSFRMRTASAFLLARPTESGKTAYVDEKANIPVA